MKLHLPKPLRAALAFAAAVVTIATVATGSSAYAEGTYADDYGTDLGTVQFVGDSITHGSDKGGTHDAASWRWAIHKIFVDNGITYSENGYHVGNCSGNGYVPVYPGGSTYGGVGWENKHSAQASGRAYELIDPVRYNRHERNSPDTLVQNYPSDKFFLLIGTNDTLSEYARSGGVGAEGNLAEFSMNLLGCTANADSSYTFSGSSHMDTIVDTFHKNTDRTAGTADDAPVVVLSIPTWSPAHSNNNQAADFAAMAEYNKRMKAWCEQKEGVIYVEVNTGLVDVANTAKPGAGVNSMFNDKLHPSGQGDLIIAGNVAKSLGYAGRSAGLVRQDAASWDHAEGALSLTSSSAAQTFAAGVFNGTNGYSIDFNATFGDGNTDNWLATSNALTITVGDGSRGGTLKMSEAYISWGDLILYSRDNSVATADNLRIAFVNGSTRAEDNVTTGYYVWLGDMLIGEGLSYSSSSFNGISLGVTGSGTGSVSGLSWVDTAYAPTTTGLLNASKAFVLEQGEFRNSYAAAAKSLNIDFTAATSTGGQYATTGKAATGVLLLKQNTTPSNSSWGGVVGTAHAGDISILYTGFGIQSSGNKSSLNLFGAINGSLSAGANTPGNLSIVLDGGVTLGAGTYDSCGSQSIIGTYDQSIAGAFRVEINNATLNGGIIMGIGHNSGAHLSVGSTLLYVNDGATVNGNIYGGNYTSNADSTTRTTTVANGTAIHITGGRVNGSVYGGNKKNGTINGGTSVVISGGYITGSVYGGSETGGTINGGTQVTVEGNTAHIGGSIQANTVTLKDVAQNTEGYVDGFDRYAGTITATNLNLENYTANALGATLNVSGTLTTKNSTNTAISKNASIGTLTLQANTRLAFNGKLSLTNGLWLTNSGTAVVLNGGYSVTTGVAQNNLYDLVLGNGTSATIDCTYTTSRLLGHASGSTLTFGEHAKATVGGIYGSDTVSSNGTLTINAGAAVISSGKVKSNILNLNGSLRVQGDLGVSTLNMSGGTLTYTKNTNAALTNVNVSGEQTSTISGNTHITGTLKVQSSSLTFDGGTHTIVNLYGDDNVDRTGVVTLRNQAAVSTNALTFGARGEKYEVESGSSLNITGRHIKVEAATDAEKATMYATYGKTNGRYTYDSGNDHFVVENARVTVTDGTTVGNQLVNAEAVADAAGANKTVTFDHSGNTLTSVKAQAGNVKVTNAGSSAGSLKSIKAEGGDVTLQGLTGATALSLTDLAICDNKTVTALTNGDTHVDGQNNVADIVVENTGRLTVGNNATLNANLTMSAGSTLSMANGSSLNMGCALTLNKGMQLATDDATETSLSTYDSVLATGYNTRWLYTSVESLTLEDVGTLSYIDGNIEGDITDFNGIDASAYFNNLTSGTYFLNVVDNGAQSFNVGITTTPEPTTATLSLLALCALAARRRRK